MSAKRLYPDVPRVRQMFKGVKRVTIPGQCMSLAEMFRRFVRREPLPVEKQAIYVESDYDLEKVSTMDRVDQEVILEEMKEKTKAAEAKIKKAEAKKAAIEAVKSSDGATPQADPKNVPT